MVFNPAPSLYNKIRLSRLHDEARTGLRIRIFSAAPRNSNSQLELELETRSLSPRAGYTNALQHHFVLQRSAPEEVGHDVIGTISSEYFTFQAATCSLTLAINGEQKRY